MNYNVLDFLENDIDVIVSTERDVFKLILKDCIKGMAAINTTNDYPTPENLQKEEDTLKGIICQL